MKRYVISLERTPERLARFKENHSGMEFEKVEAVDGYKVDASLFYTEPGWRGPFNHRRLLKGELGCFLSHFLLWERVALDPTIEGPVWIMEDDSITPNWKITQRDISDMPFNEHILYLGYNENSIDPPEEPILTSTVQIMKLKHPFNLHSYVLTKEGARKLVAAHRAGLGIMPADDFVVEASRRLGFDLHGLVRPASKQIPRTDIPSTIEPKNDDDFLFNFGVHALTYGTDQSKMNGLFDSAAAFSIHPRNLGKGKVWNGGDMTSTGGMQKLHGLKEYLEGVPDNDIVVFTDAYDVFYADDMATIVKRFLSFNMDVLFAAEKNCWPDKSLASSYPPAPTDYRFLNSGCFIGDAKVLKKILAELPTEADADDQDFLTKKFLENVTNSGDMKEYKIGLDYEGYIFQVASPSKKSGDWNQLLNPETNTMGCIYHGAGGEQAKSNFRNIYQTFAPPTQLNYIPGLKIVELLTPDVLVVDFLTKSQCEYIIEMAEKNGTWAPKPDDSYPAQEIRLKLLDGGIYDHINARWEAYIKPLIEEYFTPLKTHGIRDAFVMKYTLETQKRLDLHNDASLVTGSVKLNNDYTGADLVYPRQKISNADIPVGKILLFPGQVTHPHECQDLTSGTKYSMTIWSKRHPQDT